MKKLLMKTYLIAFLGRTDATETTYNVVEVTQVFLQCISGDVKLQSSLQMASGQARADYCCHCVTVVDSL